MHETASDDDLRTPMSAYAKAAITAAVGIALGLFATWTTTQGAYPFGAAGTGPWTTWPKTGAADADPYARAIVARQAEAPLGNGEGLFFLARADDAGRPLDGACEYTIEMTAPVARFWTLTMYTPKGGPIAAPGGRRAVTSTSVVRRAGGGLSIVVAPSARAGNWIASPRESYALALALYDSGVSPTPAAIEGLALPSIRREECP